MQVKFIPRREDGAVTIEDVKNTVDSNTRLVSLSSVNFITGYKVDITAIGKYLHEKGILFCVDGVQSLGQCSLNITNVDFLSSGAQKWLLSPSGTGILYINRRHFSTLHPAIVGWKTVESNHDYLNYRHAFLPSAQKYESGTLNNIGIVGLHAALGLLLEIGIENIAARIARLREMCVESLLGKGYQVAGANYGKTGAGIVSFRSSKKDVTEFRPRFEAEGFMVSYREDLAGNRCVRLSGDEQIIRLYRARKDSFSLPWVRYSCRAAILSARYT